MLTYKATEELILISISLQQFSFFKDCITDTEQHLRLNLYSQGSLFSFIDPSAAVDTVNQMIPLSV